MIGRRHHGFHLTQPSSTESEADRCIANDMRCNLRGLDVCSTFCCRCARSSLPNAGRISYEVLAQGGVDGARPQFNRQHGKVAALAPIRPLPATFLRDTFVVNFHSVKKRANTRDLHESFVAPTPNTLLRRIQVASNFSCSQSPFKSPSASSLHVAPSLPPYSDVWHEKDDVRNNGRYLTTICDQM